MNKTILWILIIIQMLFAIAYIITFDDAIFISEMIFGAAAILQYSNNKNSTHAKTTTITGE